MNVGHMFFAADEGRVYDPSGLRSLERVAGVEPSAPGIEGQLQLNDTFLVEDEDFGLDDQALDFQMKLRVGDYLRVFWSDRGGLYAMVWVVAE